MRPGLVNSRAGLAFAAAALLLGAVAQGAEAPEAPSRDSAWRAIFARPAPEPAPAAGSPEAARIELGALLFNDTRLSADGNRACASCHQPALGFTDGRARALGRAGQSLRRNAPSLFNVRWGERFFWDGRAGSLEEQARGPLLAADEMAGDFAVMVARLSADSTMAARFAAAFPASPVISETTILDAITAFERTISSPRSRFDSWVVGDDGALNDIEKKGMGLFVGRAGCVSCHGGWRFTDELFHDTGLPGDDPGRGAVPGGRPGLPQFKTPGLRELVSTAPYMHDGSLATLEAVVDHYNKGRIERPSLDINIVRDMRLSDEEKAALVAFLKTLSGPAAP